MTRQELKIYGKVSNLVPEVRTAYLAGILDFLEITGKNAEEGKFVLKMYNYLAEHGENHYREFMEKYKEDDV